MLLRFNTTEWRIIFISSFWNYFRIEFETFFNPNVLRDKCTDLNEIQKVGGGYYEIAHVALSWSGKNCILNQNVVFSIHIQHEVQHWIWIASQSCLLYLCEFY